MIAPWAKGGAWPIAAIALAVWAPLTAKADPAPPHAAAPAPVTAPVLSPATAAAPERAAAEGVTLPAETVLQIVIVDEVSSVNRTRGDMFRIRLGAPVVIDGRTVLPAGVEGVGQVTSAARPGMAGRPGELMIAARYLEHEGVRIPLRGMTVSRAGQSYGDQVLVATTAMSMVSPVLSLAGFAVRGGNVVVPPGTIGYAKVAAAVVIPAVAPSPAAEPAPAEAPSSETQAPSAAASAPAAQGPAEPSAPFNPNSTEAAP